MEHYGKNKKIYHGIAIPFILMLILPVIFFYVFYFAIGSFSKSPYIVVIYMSLAFGGLVGVLFEVSCVIAGFIHDIFVSMIRRIGNFFTNVKIFKKNAVKWYWDDFKENGGIIFWIFVLVFLVTLFMSLYGFVQFGRWYSLG